VLKGFFYLILKSKIKSTQSDPRSVEPKFLSPWTHELELNVCYINHEVKYDLVTELLSFLIVQQHDQTVQVEIVRHFLTIIKPSKYSL
jgi:hypothetical protein